MLRVNKRRKLTAHFALLVSTCWLTSAHAEPVDAPSTTHPAALQNAQALARHLAAEPQRVAVVLVSTPGCGFCDRLRQSQLAPLQTQPAYRDLQFYEMMMNDRKAFTQGPVRLNTGNTGRLFRSPAELAHALGIRVAPTVLFLGGTRELAERLIGYGAPDFYWAYLSERLNSARARIKEPMAR